MDLYEVLKIIAFLVLVVLVFKIEDEDLKVLGFTGLVLIAVAAFGMYELRWVAVALAFVVLAYVILKSK